MSDTASQKASLLYQDPKKCELDIDFDMLLSDSAE